MYYTKTLSDGTVVTAEQMREVCEAQSDGMYRPARAEGHQDVNGRWFVVHPDGRLPLLASGRQYGTRAEVQDFVDQLNDAR